MGQSLQPAIKNFLHLCLTASLMLPSMTYAANDGQQTAPMNSQDNAQETNTYLSSKKSFHDLMQDSFINSSYFDGLRNNLRYVPDKIQADFYDNNPFFQNPEMAQAERAVMEEDVNSAVKDGQMSMTRITAKTDKWLFDIIQEIAREYGYRDQDIARIDAFIMPELNASNFSPFMDHMGIYVGKPLVDLMRVQMANANFDRRRGVETMKGIIGHEFMHNISGHGLQGFRNTSMVLQMAGIFAKGAGFSNIDFHFLETYDPKNLNGMDPAVHAFWGGIFSRAALSFMPQESPSAKPSKLLIKYLKATDGEFKKVSDTPQTVRNALGLLNGSTMANADAGTESILGFLRMTITALELMPVPDRQISYLKHLADNFQQALQEGRAPYQVDPNEFMQIMGDVLANLGKAMEISADNGGLSQTNYKDMSEGFLRFMNVDLDPVLADYIGEDGQPTMTVRQMRDNALQEKQEEWTRFLSENSDKDILDQLGGSNSKDHPAPLKRLMHFFLQSQGTGTIAYRNSFLKHVTMYDQLIAQESMGEGLVQALQARLANFLAQAQKPDSQIPATLIERAKQETADKIKAIQAKRKNSAEKAEVVSLSIMRLINDPALPKLDGRNPRLADYIDYQLALRQDRLEMMTRFLEQVAPEKRPGLQAMIESQTPSQDSPLLRDLVKQLKAKGRQKGSDVAQIKRRESELNEVISKTAKIKDIQDARAELRGFMKSSSRANRIAIEKPDPAKLFSTPGPDCRAIIMRATN